MISLNGTSRIVKGGAVFFALLLAGEAAISAGRPRFKTYGFFDMEVQASFDREDSDPWTFNQHHLNFIAIYPLSHNYRIFSEVEYEHGPTLSRNESSGKIYLAKGFLEYKHSDALRLRMGKFLSPFGIYNERHDATPTFIFTKLPYSVYGKHPLASGYKDRLFSKFTTGVQLVGNIYPGSWELRYQLYAGNGRGAAPGGSDDNSNKGLGGRLVITPPGGRLRLGASFYADKHGLDYGTLQRSLGLDAEFDAGNYHMEFELLRHHAEQLDSLNRPNGRYKVHLGYYLLGAYTFLEKITPFFRYDYIDHDTDEPGAAEIIGIVGLNISLTTRVYLKNEIHFIRATKSLSGASKTTDRYGMYVGSIAAAF